MDHAFTGTTQHAATAKAPNIIFVFIVHLLLLEDIAISVPDCMSTQHIDIATIYS
jgi:hypothetical protein